VRGTVNGEYLKKLGVKTGPVYREVLGALLDARLDGKVASAEDEERFVREWLRDRGTGKGAEGTARET
jgi:tRNA nucleotidyltransferase (CCA-adding enzyme)